MGKRKYFIISLLLVICALCSDFASKACFSKSTFLLAKSSSTPETNKTQAKIESDKFLHRGTIFHRVGVGLAILSFLFWIVSEARRESIWRLIPLGLLIFYLFLQFMMV